LVKGKLSTPYKISTLLGKISKEQNKEDY